MDDPARKDLIGHLFALVTAKLEDASALAERVRRLTRLGLKI